jgi:hypothetical protein
MVERETTPSSPLKASIPGKRFLFPGLKSNNMQLYIFAFLDPFESQLKLREISKLGIELQPKIVDYIHDEEFIREVLFKNDHAIGMKLYNHTKCSIKFKEAHTYRNINFTIPDLFKESI